jgi:hypothetical protein
VVAAVVVIEIAAAVEIKDNNFKKNSTFAGLFWNYEL